MGQALLQVESYLQELFILVRPKFQTPLNLLDLGVTSGQEPWLGKTALIQCPTESGLPPHLEPSPTSRSRPGETTIASGIYLLKRALLAYLKSNKLTSLETVELENLKKEGLFQHITYPMKPLGQGNPGDQKTLNFSRFYFKQECPHRERPAIFLDRDGVLNRDTGYVHSPRKFEWICGAKTAVKFLNDQGYYVFVVTNQSGIARGYYPEDAVLSLHRWMNDELRLLGAHVDQFYYCPHHHDGVISEFNLDCECRKPKPGLIEQALNEWPILRDNSLLIGDMPRDIEAAQSAGIPGHLFNQKNLHTFIHQLLTSPSENTK